MPEDQGRRRLRDWVDTQTTTGDEERAAGKVIQGWRWQFAKTMPKWPHWYACLKWCPPGEFSWLAKLIFEHGADERFGGKRFRFLVINGWKYWSMDPTWQTTDLINRKPMPGVTHGPGGEGDPMPLPEAPSRRRGIEYGRR